jgi:hypothetical protein
LEPAMVAISASASLADPHDPRDQFARGYGVTVRRTARK